VPHGELEEEDESSDEEMEPEQFKVNDPNI
jgi:hypothetical protein